MNYKEFLLANGIMLSKIGINEIALDKANALIAIDLLKSENTPILGGDVYKIIKDKISITYDNWYYNLDNTVDIQKAVEISFEEAKKYINNYLEDSDSKVLFVLVIKSL